MGALHNGHLELIRKSRSLTDLTAVSIFVNPTQFNNQEDFEKYPITLEADLEKLASEGVDYVFVPTVETMYPSETQLKFDFGDLERVLEGKFRPGHFNGVGIIVAKLFHMIRPHIAFFGQKDLQQISVIRQLVKGLSFDIELEVVPTKREDDGLAMSSRNVRLDPQERKDALILHKSLEKAKAALLEGSPWQTVQDQAVSDFNKVASVQMEYFELVNPETFVRYSKFDRNQCTSICVAAYVGKTRLIDNAPIVP